MDADKIGFWKRPSRTTLLCIGIVALSFGSTAAWAGNVGAASDPTSYLADFSQKMTADDSLPDRDGGRLYEGAGLLYETSRLIGADDKAKYWAVITEDKLICAVIVLGGRGDSAMACTSPDAFGKRGLSVGVLSKDSTDEIGYREAYLVPDSLTFTSLPSGLTQVTKNLAAGDSRGTVDALTASTVDGRYSLRINLVKQSPSSSDR